ncbi:MAG TPA: hypothetical protein VNK04_22020 [Gemmataceae bacterium]|nr:hypothetical protein [Gemmataceae bacterium]
MQAYIFKHDDPLIQSSPYWPHLPRWYKWLCKLAVLAEYRRRFGAQLAAG